MNYKFEFTRDEYLLLGGAILVAYCNTGNISEKEDLKALLDKISSAYNNEKEDEKPRIKQYDILKPYEDANKNVKFVAVDEAIENLYEIELNVYERMTCSGAINKRCKSSKRKNKNKDEDFLHSLPEFTLQKKLDISNKNYRDILGSIYKIEMTKEETKVLYGAIGNLRTNDLHSIDPVATHGKAIKLMNRIKDKMSSEWEND